MESKDCSDELLSVNEQYLIENWKKDNLCYPATKNLAELCLFPGTPGKTHLKSNELEYLLKEISKHQSVQSADNFS